MFLLIVANIVFDAQIRALLAPLMPELAEPQYNANFSIRILFAYILTTSLGLFYEAVRKNTQKKFEENVLALRKMTEIGARERYRPYHDRARAQIGRELALIEKLDLAGYFLIVWDIVNFCRQQGILVQGRGSAANSAVCYSLGITAVDPVGMDLLFERFLSEERGEWPDAQKPGSPSSVQVHRWLLDRWHCRHR